MIAPGIEGKVALVTGTNNPRGIGATTAKALSAQGVRVVGVYLGDPDGERVANAVRTAGGEIPVHELDITAEGAAAEAFDVAERHFGPVDILVNNACADGLDTFLPAGAEQPDIVGRPQQTISRASFEQQFGVNTRAPALLMAESARRHLARSAPWGRIVNISTDGAAGGPREIS